jgi:hypothetical protein
MVLGECEATAAQKKAAQLESLHLRAKNLIVKANRGRRVCSARPRMSA